MAFDAGSIVARLGLDGSGFAAGILNAQGLTSLLGSSISGFLANPLLGVANAAKQAVGAIQDLVLGTAASADQFAKMAKATGASVEWLSGMKHAAELSGTSMEAVSASVNKLAKGLSDAKAGTGEAASALKALGVSAVESDGSLRNVQDVYLDVATALAGMDNQTQRAAAAQRLFGESAGQLVPLLAEGADGINRMVAEARELGLTFDEESAGAAERFNDSLLRLKAGLAGAFQEAVTPIFSELAGLFTELAPVIRQVAHGIGTLLGGALKAVVPIVRVVLKVLEPLLQVIGLILEGVGALFDAIGRGLGAAPSAAGAGVSVAVEVSPEDSARRVADKVAPAIADGVRSTQHRMEQSAHTRMGLHDYEQSLALR